MFRAIKTGLAFAPPLLCSGLRAEIAGIARLLTLAPVGRRPLLPADAGWPAVVALALTSTTLAFAAIFLSPGRTGAWVLRSSDDRCAGSSRCEDAPRAFAPLGCGRLA